MFGMEISHIGKQVLLEINNNRYFPYSLYLSLDKQIDPLNGYL